MKSNTASKIKTFTKNNQIGMALIISAVLFLATIILNPKSLNPVAFVIRVKDGQQLSTNWLFTPSPTKALPGVDKGVLVEKWRANESIHIIL